MAKEESKVVKYLDNKVEIKAKPLVGENIPIYIRPGDKIDLQSLGINLETANFKLIGGDIVLDVPGGGSFTFVSLALMGYSDSQPEFLGVGGKLVSLGTILSNIEEVNAIPVSSVVTNEFVNMPPATPEEIKKEKISQVILSDNNPSTEEKSNIAESIAESTAQQQNTGEAEVNENIAMQTKTKSQTKTEDSKVEGIAPTITFDIDIQHVEIKENTTYDADGKTLTVYGGGGVSYANIYPKGYNSVDKTTLMAQTKAEMIDYSDKKFGSYDKVVIYADNPDLFSNTKTSRTIVLTPNQPEGFAITQITISSNSLPSGFKVLNGVQSGNSWIIQKDDPLTDTIEGFTIDSKGAVNITFSLDSNQESNFVFSLTTTSQFSMDNVSEANKSTIKPPVKTTITAEKEYAVQVKDIEDETQAVEYNFNSFSLNGKDYTSGFVISTNINDTETVGAQELVNTIFGGIVNDTITGGLLSDTIYGNTGNDTIVTRAGNDVVDGGEGVDTLDYSEIDNISNVGIDANLNTGIVTYKIDTNSKIDPDTTFTDTIANIENIIATQDKDIIVGNAQNNTLKGEGGADTISGGAGEDSIEGADGNDTISGNAGNDILRAGAGNDTVSYKTAVNTVGTSAGVIVNLSDDPDDATKGKTTGIDGEDYLWDFENVIASNYDDTVIGNTLKNSIWAEDGNDTLNGGLGNDYLDGGNGSDTIDYSTSNASEFIYLESSTVSGIIVGEASGGDGEDSLYGIENVIGSIYADTIYGSSVSNTLDAGRGNDTIYAAAGNDSINGGSGDDILNGETGNDTILAGLGNDTLSGGSGDDILNGGSGNDYVNYSELSNSSGDLKGVEVDLTITSQQDTKKDGLDTLSEIENVIGSSYNDTIIGTTGDNIILAGAGNDTIVSNGSSALGSDTIDGQSGDRDLLTYENTGLTSKITVDLNSLVSQDTGAGNITIKNVEDVSGANGGDLLTGNDSTNILKGFAGNDTLIGNGGADSLYGGNNDDKLYGGTENDLLEGEEGNDTLVGGVGSDTLNGGNGVDTADFSSETAKLKVILGANDTAANATIGNTDTDILSSIENVIGTQFNDEITGNNKANSIDAGSGNDTLDGGVDSEIDILRGNLGDDTFILRADAGVDIVDGGNGLDTVDYTALSSSENLSLTLNSSSSTIATIKDGSLIYTDSIENIENIKSGAGNDTLIGSDLNNTISSNAGDDTLSGGKGNDYLDGGIGIDTADFTYVTSGTGVNANLTQNVAFDIFVDTEKQIGSDQIFNIENVKGTAYADSIVGNEQANLLEGNSGNDFLSGLAGNDILLGGLGNDILRGGTGDDILNGGIGIDTADYSDATEDLIIDLNSQGEKTVSIAQGKDTFIDIEGAIGGDGNDILIGTTGANTLVGGRGNDTILGNGASSGTDYIDGGENTLGGADLVSFAYTNKNITIDLSYNTGSNENVAQISGDGNIIIKNIENIQGSFGDDKLTGNDDVNTIFGATGNDTLVGKGGNDYLDGGADEYSHKLTVSGTPAAGNTYILMIGLIAITFVAQSANANDIMAGLLTEFEKNNEAKKLASLIKVTEGSSDVLYLYSQENISLTNLTDTLIAYNDTADYSSGNKIIADMNAGTDTSIIEKGEVTLSDGSKDTLVSIENITGSSYDDTIKGDIDDNIANIFDGGAGNDTIYGGAGNDTIYGRDGNDLIRGDDGDDSLDGGTGNDTFIATGSNDGQDVIDGGNDSDTVDYSAIVDGDSDGTTGGITVNLADQFTSTSATVTVNGGNNDTLKNIENIIGTQNNDTITASQEINTLKGSAGNDLFIQTATGVNGDDIDGGDDIDTVDYTALSSGVTVTLNTSTYSTVTSGSTTHKIVNIENVTGTSQVDFVVGDTAANTLVGNDGNDTLYGGDNDDKLYGGNNDDILRGGSGNDLLDGGNGIDTADYSDAIENLDVNIADGAKFISSSQGTDTFSSIEGVIGGSGNDKLTGNTKANTLIGNNGNDILDGAGTSTALAGEYDYLDGGAGEDSVSYKDFTSAVTINLGLTYGNSLDIHNFDASSVKDYQDAGAAGNIRILNVENLEGGSANDTIYGNASDNTLIGRDGEDTFRGGAGNDVIIGGIVLTTDSNGEILTQTDGYVDTADYSYLTTNKGIIVDMNIAGEDDSILNKGRVEQDGHYNSDILYGIERIIGSQYADQIIGDTDDNVNNTFEGKAGDDTLSGGSGNDSLLGGTENDTLDGGSGNDSLSGEAGDDLFKASSYNDGDDTFDGEKDTVTDSGVDTVDYSVITDATYHLEVNLSSVNVGTMNAGKAYVKDSGTTYQTDTLKNIENVIGTSGADTFVGDAENNVFNGRSGNDTVSYENITGSTAITIDLKNDIATGDGIDTLTNIENATGGAGDDIVKVSTDVELNVLDGNSGVDTVSYEYYTTAVIRNLAITTSQGGADIATNGDVLKNFENIIGGSANDSFKGNSLANILNGGSAGLDTADYSDSSALIVAHMDTATKTVTSGTDIDSLVSIEKVIGSSHNDTFYSDLSANNVFVGGSQDALGADVLDYSTMVVTDPVKYYVYLDLSDQSASVKQNNVITAIDTFSEIEKFILTSGNDTIKGNVDANTIDGSGGSDTVRYDYLTTGNSVIVNFDTSSALTTVSGDSDSYVSIENAYGSSGNDTFIMNDADNEENTVDGGSSGVDTISYENYATKVTVNLGATDGINTVKSGDTDTILNIDNLIGGSVGG